MAPKLTITANGPNNGNGSISRKDAKKAKRNLAQFATPSEQTAFNGLNNGQQIAKLRDMALEIVAQNNNLLIRVKALEAEVRLLKAK